MKLYRILFLSFIVILSACGGRNQSSEQKQQSQPETEINDSEPRSATATAHPGKKVYDSVCLACHMANGTGVPGMFPPLANTDWVTGDKEQLIRITIQGLSGKIEVNGTTYNNIMPPNSHLSDREIADVLTYIRQSFGNDASEVTVEEVSTVRNNL
ncbi:MAG TPA: cytochrome c [Mariniphaga sp.]|nr:cytochrome c [Mariniphaga sp.]